MLVTWCGTATSCSGLAATCRIAWDWGWSTWSTSTWVQINHLYLLYTCLSEFRPVFRWLSPFWRTLRHVLRLYVFLGVSPRLLFLLGHCDLLVLPYRLHKDIFSHRTPVVQSQSFIWRLECCLGGRKTRSCFQLGLTLADAATVELGWGHSWSLWVLFQQVAQLVGGSFDIHY